MNIHLENVSKKYFKEWIFKNINYQFLDLKSYAIVGANGAGKSTFLQVLAGLMPATEGKISYKKNAAAIDAPDVYKYQSIVAPYQSLIDELTLEELYQFHFSFKTTLYPDITFGEWLDRLNLSKQGNKQLGNFSSGMKQRVKLGLAFYTHNHLLLLDEPTNNLDNQGIEWYLSEMKNLEQKCTLIICSNQRQEYSFCQNIVELKNWK